MATLRKVPRIIAITGIVLLILLVYRLSSGSYPPRTPYVSSARNWSSFRHYHPPGPIKALPGGTPRKLPSVQADSSLFINDSVNIKRREAVREAFQKSWSSYKEYAWMRDELKPLTAGAKDSLGGWAATLVDALDTLWIMGLRDEFAAAAKAAASIDWSKTSAGAANIFETTIRHLGGLLSAYDLSGEGALLVKAVELGDMLYAGFDTPNRFPGFWLNFEDAELGIQTAGTNDASAAPASLCLEFTRLSQITGDPKYYDATDRITRFLERTQRKSKLPGMWPKTLNFRDETVDDSSFTLGALADSLYEYLPKMHALLGGVDPTYEKMYRQATDTALKHLIFRPMTLDSRDILFSGDVRVYNQKIEFIPESQHLTCFVGGMFGLGGKLFEIKDHVLIGDRLARGCGWAYASFPTGIMPEIFGLHACPSLDPCKFKEDTYDESSSNPPGFKNARDPQYQLRPEAIESIFLLYRMTGSNDLRDMAWKMFESIMKHTATEFGNAAIRDVATKEEPSKVDSMESFWMAETLKYFYLIFCEPEVIHLDYWVLNTEAHPLRRPIPGQRQEDTSDN